jgi:hypothetical protein
MSSLSLKVDAASRGKSHTGAKNEALQVIVPPAHTGGSDHRERTDILDVTSHCTTLDLGAE